MDPIVSRLEKLDEQAQKLETEIAGLEQKLEEERDDVKAKRLEENIRDLKDKEKGILAERAIVAGKLQAAGMRMSVLLVIFMSLCALSK